MKGTKDLILKTAKKLFGKNGLTRTSMDDIAADAKIGKGTIYHYYDSKEKLFIDVAEQEVERLRQNLVAAIPAGAGPEEKLRAYALGRFRLVGEITKIFSMFKEEYDQYYSYIKKVEDKFRDFETSMIKQFLKAGIDTGVFAVEDVDFVTSALIEIVHRMEYYFAVPENQGVMEKRSGLLLDMIMNGIKKK